jgi:hypothetical protein
MIQKGVAVARRILVLFWYPTAMRPAIRHHVRTFEASPLGHQVLYFNVRDGVPVWFRYLPCDVIVLHTTLLCLRWGDQFSRLKWDLRWLRDSPALKIAMPQDEYDHAEVLDEWLDELRVSVICTNFDEAFTPQLYPRMHMQARFIKALTGYIDTPTAEAVTPKLRPIAQRPLDLVYRAAHLPYWFGGHGQLKHRIADIISRRAEEVGLRCDLSTRPEDAITSDAWFDFLASAKATIGCESGSSVLDRRGEIRAKVQWLLERTPGLRFEDVSDCLPRGWDDHRFFALGPRHLEAVITRTCQVLVEGDYDGVLQANRHYLPLRRDLGNLDDVLHMARDHALLEKTATRAYEDLYLSGRYTYRSFAIQLDEIITPAPARGHRWFPWCMAGWLMRAAGPLLRVKRALPVILEATLHALSRLAGSIGRFLAAYVTTPLYGLALLFGRPRSAAPERPS